jgi:hypothetical protein
LQNVSFNPSNSDSLICGIGLLSPHLSWLQGELLKVCEKLECKNFLTWILSSPYLLCSQLKPHPTLASVWTRTHAASVATVASWFFVYK